MAFLQKSAKAYLRELFPIQGASRRRVRCGDSAAAACTLGDGSVAKLGLIVYDERDPRHEGEIIEIWNSGRAQIRWIEHGWKSLGGRDGIPLRFLHNIENRKD